MVNVAEAFSLSGNLLKKFNKFLFLHFLNIFNKFVCISGNSRWKLLYLYGLQSFGLDLLAGVTLLLLPLPSTFSLVGFIMIGLGLAPIFPCMLHETPTRFAKKHSQTIMGYQMAVAYTGSTFIPPLLGFIASHSGNRNLPILYCCFCCSNAPKFRKIKYLTDKEGCIQEERYKLNSILIM